MSLLPIGCTHILRPTVGEVYTIRPFRKGPNNIAEYFSEFCGWFEMVAWPTNDDLDDKGLFEAVNNAQ